jgi:hypothetical protein
MISESAMGMSNGGRVSSATAAIMNTPNMTGWVNTYQYCCWASLIPMSDTVPACMTTATAARISGSS